MVKKINISLLCVMATSMALEASEPTDTLPAAALDEVVVTGQSVRQRVAERRIGSERLELSRLAEVPAFAGENDIVKSISLLPGVHAEGEGAGGFEVRGGNASQNLVLLDGMSLYNPTHVMGIFSTFNDQALGRATLYKGPLPAMFGGASSSVLETSLAPGDMTRWHGAFTVGLLAAKIKAEGPVVKDCLSVAVSARRSYVDAFLKLVPDYRHIVMNFYDVTARVRYTPDADNIIDGSFFMGRDNMAIGGLMGMHWGNIAGSVNWTARAADRLQFVTTASLTHYDPRMSMDMMDVDQTLRTFIHTYSVNENVRLALSDSHSLDFGLRSELFRVKSAELTSMSVSLQEIRSLWENSAWAEWQGSFADRLDVTAGVRLDVSSALSQPRFHTFVDTGDADAEFDAKTYVDVQPRVSLKYSVSPMHNIKAGFGVATQNLHSIRSSATTFPFDRYALTSAEVRPERSLQYSAGYCGMTPTGAFDWSAEIYWRDIRNVYDYMDGRDSFSEVSLESIILSGRGRSYGLEVMARKNTGRLTGWVSYTISRTQTRIPGINGGRWYDASNDRRHDFSVTAAYRFNDRWSMSGSWIFSSGQPLTVPDVKYEIGGETCYYYYTRNGYKTPSTHRLDLSATYTHRGPKFTYEWAFGVYNAYCRYNPYIIYFENDPDSPSGTRAVQQSLYGIVPSVSYTLKF